MRQEGTVRCWAEFGFPAIVMNIIHSSGVGHCSPCSEEDHGYFPNEVDRRSLQEMVDPDLPPNASESPFRETHLSFLELVGKIPISIGHTEDRNWEILSAK